MIPHQFQINMQDFRPPSWFAYFRWHVFWVRMELIFANKFCLNFWGDVRKTATECSIIDVDPYIIWRAQRKNDSTPFLKKMSYDVFPIGEFNLNILVKTAWRYSNSKYFFSNFDVTLVAYFSSLSLLTKMKKTQKCSKWAWNHTNLLKIL